MSESSLYSEHIVHFFDSPADSPIGSPGGDLDVVVNRRRTFERRTTSYSRGAVVTNFMEYEVFNILEQLSQSWMFGENVEIGSKISDYNKMRMERMLTIYGDKNGRAVYVHTTSTASDCSDDYGCVKLHITATGRMERCAACGEIKEKKDICEHAGFALWKLEQVGLHHVVGRTLSHVGCEDDGKLSFPSLARRKLVYPLECDSNSDDTPRSVISEGEDKDLLDRYYNTAEVSWNFCYKEALVEHGECGKPRSDVKVDFMGGMFHCSSDGCHLKQEGGLLCKHLTQTLLCAVKHNICKEETSATLEHFDAFGNNRVELMKDFSMVLVWSNDDEETLICYNKGILTCRNALCHSKKNLPTRMCGHIRTAITYLLLRTKIPEVVQKTIEYWEVLHKAYDALYPKIDPLEHLLENSDTSSDEDSLSDRLDSSGCEDSYGVLLCDHITLDRFRQLYS